VITPTTAAVTTWPSTGHTIDIATMRTTVIMAAIGRTRARPRSLDQRTSRPARDGDAAAAGPGAGTGVVSSGLPGIVAPQVP
jgi:hypothetical protein